MRVLSIDGGGIRGIIPALVLAEIERRSQKRVFELFDLIAGTSTGGILACALCAPDPLPAEQLVGLYEEEGPHIFDRSVWQRIRSAEGLLDEKYSADALDRALERFLSDKRLADTKPDLLVPAYNMGEPGPYFFKSRKAREEGEDFPLSVVARATSAAPTYFEPSQLNDQALVDGYVAVLGRFLERVGHIVLIDTNQDGLPIGCVRQTLRGECAQLQPNVEAIDRFNGVLHTVAQRFPGRVSVISLADLVCPGGTCLPIRDGMLIRYDGQHYTATFSRWLGPQLMDRIDQAAGVGF